MKTEIRLDFYVCQASMMEQWQQLLKYVLDEENELEEGLLNKFNKAKAVYNIFW